MFNHIAVWSLLGTLPTACAGRSEVAFDAPVEDVVRACEPRSAAPFELSRPVLVSDSEGNLPADRHGGNLAQAFRTIMGGYAEAAAGSPARPPRLLFYFNGGLNSQALVEQQARRLRDHWELIRSEWLCVNGRDVPLKPPTPADEQLDQEIRAALADARITLIGHSMGAIVSTSCSTASATCRTPTSW